MRGAAVTGPVFDPIWQWRHFRLALSQATSSGGFRIDLYQNAPGAAGSTSDSGASGELSASGYPLSANIGIKRQLHARRYLPLERYEFARGPQSLRLPAGRL